MNILAVDPGSRKAGVAYLKSGVLQFSCQLSFDDKLDISERYNQIALAFLDILDTIDSVDIIAIEMPFAGRNASTAVKLGSVRGIFIGVLLSRFKSASVMDMQTFTIRRMLGIGNGSDKDLMHAAAGINNHIKEDAQDAISIGIAAERYYGIQRKERALRPKVSRRKRTTGAGKH